MNRIGGILMQTILDIIGTFLLIVAVGVLVYYGMWFYSTLNEEKILDKE